MSLLPVLTSEQQSSQLIVDIQHVYTTFDTCINDGTANAITNDKLHHILHTHTGVNYTATQIQDMIDSVDTNTSGDIQFTEFLVAMNKVMKTDGARSRPGSAVIGGVMRPKTGKAKQTSDTNDTTLLRSVFATLDCDGDGYIGVEDLKLMYDNNGEVMSESEVAALAHMCDVGGGGNISYAAFEKLVIEGK